MLLQLALVANEVSHLNSENKHLSIQFVQCECIQNLMTDFYYCRISVQEEILDETDEYIDIHNK
jgi:hypothetical protein